LCRICSRANLDSQLETLAASITASNANAVANDAAAAYDATVTHDATAANDAAANDAAANDAAANDAATSDDVTGSPCDVGLRSSNWICYASASMHPS
jgi:hypothetical protein